MKDAIRQYVVEELLGDTNGRQLADEDNLLAGDLLDSIGMMRLVTFIEDHFDLEVPAEDVIIDHFLNITAIARYIDTRKGAS